MSPASLPAQRTTDILCVATSTHTYRWACSLVIVRADSTRPHGEFDCNGEARWTIAQAHSNDDALDALTGPQARTNFPIKPHRIPRRASRLKHQIAPNLLFFT